MSGLTVSLPHWAAVALHGAPVPGMLLRACMHPLAAHAAPASQPSGPPPPPARPAQVVLKVIQPYTRVRIPFIAQQLNIPPPDVERLLINLILDKRVDGHIDQVGLAACVCGRGACCLAQGMVWRRALCEHVLRRRCYSVAAILVSSCKYPGWLAAAMALEQGAFFMGPS